ncbi:hypothetical protein ACEWY4_022816 [Coilia grayii]|uniref:C1q domain-containing protein n=1 Tax=Coilia grayii TaxID=363190 RepID=A0ABD1J196_9TELE
MRAAISLLVLLFSMCGAQTQSTQTEVQTESQSTGAAAAAAAAEVSTQLDIFAELKELRDMVQKQNAELSAVKTRLAASEAENAELKTRLAVTETEVLNLKTEVELKPKVAFSAGLTNSGYVESGNTEMNLVFTKVITNVGQAYSRITGFFTAPVRGVYYFRFTVMDILNTRLMFIKMFKNGQQVVNLAEYDTDAHITYLSSGVTLQLEVGDVVNMRLPPGTRLFDDAANHNIFSGFLIFAL